MNEGETYVFFVFSVVAVLLPLMYFLLVYFTDRD